MFTNSLKVVNSGAALVLEEEILERNIPFLMAYTDHEFIWSFKSERDLYKVKDEARRRGLLIPNSVSMAA